MYLHFMLQHQSVMQLAAANIKASGLYAGALFFAQKCGLMNNSFVS
jgi:hypothetical protein